MPNWMGDQQHDWRLVPPRLFCFPYAGAGSSVFRGWRHLLPSIDVKPVTLPGHGERVTAPLHRRMGPLVDVLCAQLKPLIDRPFALFGHSMGALVAFEVARSLQAAGNVPQHLFASGCRAPGYVNDGREALHRLSETEFVDRIASMRGTPPEVLRDRGLMEMFVPILKADFEIVETYRPAPGAPLACPITAVGGLEDIDDIPVNMLTGWQEQTAAGFVHHMVPGDHFFIHHRAELLSQIILHGLRGSMA